MLESFSTEQIDFLIYQTSYSDYTDFHKLLIYNTIYDKLQSYSTFNSNPTSSNFEKSNLSFFDVKNGLN